MTCAWKNETLAVIAGLLRDQRPDLSTFEVVRSVWVTASKEPPQIGGLRLLARTRLLVEALTSQRRRQQRQDFFAIVSSP